MPPRRRDGNQDGDNESSREHKRSRKSIRDRKAEPTTNLEPIVPADSTSKVTLRFKKVDYVSITRKYQIKNTIVVNFLLKSLDLDLLKFPEKAVLFFFDEDMAEKVGKIHSYVCSIENSVVNLKIELGRVVNKSAWEREFYTDEYFYNEYILGLNKFWYLSSLELDELVKPLGFIRKSYEDDTMFKRRIVAYLQATLKPSIDVMEMLNEDIKKNLPPSND